MEEQTNTNIEEPQIKYLEMIEKIIERMAHNSLTVKGWTAAITSIVATLVTKSASNGYIFSVALGLLCIDVAFAYMNAFYLQIERKYRKLYEKALMQNSKIKLFDLNIDKINAKNEKDKKLTLMNCIKSKSVWPFYLAIAAAIMLLMIYSVYRHFQ